MSAEQTDPGPGGPVELAASGPRRPHRAGRLAVVTTVTLLAGLIFGVSASIAHDRGTTGEVTSLRDLIAERDHQVRQLAAQADDLRAQVQRLEREQSGSAGAVAAARADQLAPGAGLAAVSGPGLRVTLDDAGYTLDTLPPGVEVNDVVVHQQDLQAVVNALWAGGAEAVMVMDQRVISSSAVQCVGNTLYLQGRVYAPPFTVTAVGDVARMGAALQADPSLTVYRQWADQVGLGYEVHRLGTVRLPAFEGSTAPRYARVAEQS